MSRTEIPVSQAEAPLALLPDTLAKPERPAKAEPPPARIIEIGEVAAGIAVPEHRGVRFFASSDAFFPLDGTVFPSVEQAARAARERFRSLRPAGRRLAAV
ncbi:MULTISPECIES: hypothetical protein [Methylobacterium]|uniref:Uncharacterized protein n=2 Tax=Pseudomonadota TaxID=1224 RepID=A0ABQ4SWW3_9HYPH|nr:MULTISPECIES: hypothetical protein [Methylobacterium]PIU05801.1 MAG: hypothetical protein COT56_12765 [Methylobacterium sp. CG09_land_8_20_14_0_10_71_15]PIU13932.1 MAG: hypothetical protein COT28_09295 [Methylobacterium sp. CG08_land_8_20_14_0_20_71_15]GBU17376.1 hypothetical protein AwMethylo_15910 [Methylobacterium sp.]GJE07695.1 hypothetical protein AOPFMNJM_3025 [Methylobacterium jeotgali]